MEKGNRRWLISFNCLEIKTVTGVVITPGRWWKLSVTTLQPACSSHPARSPPPWRERIFFFENSPCWVREERFCWNATSNGGHNTYPRVQWCHSFSAVRWMCHETQSFFMDSATPPEIWEISRTRLLELMNTFLLVQYCCSITSWAHAMHKYKFTGKTSGSWLFSSDLHNKISSLVLFSSEETSLLAEKQRIPRLFLCWLIFPHVFRHTEANGYQQAVPTKGVKLVFQCHRSTITRQYCTPTTQ